MGPELIMNYELFEVDLSIAILIQSEEVPEHILVLLNAHLLEYFHNQLLDLLREQGFPSWDEIRVVKGTELVPNLGVENFSLLFFDSHHFLLGRRFDLLSLGEQGVDEGLEFWVGSGEYT